MRSQEYQLSYQTNLVSHTNASLALCPDLTRLYQLTENDRDEVMRFLNTKPVHTIAMSSFINDNGIESPANRGSFYGYRGNDGKFEGVALIGHTTLIEAHSTEAVRAFAFEAKRGIKPINLVMASDVVARTFWLNYAGSLRKPRISSSEILFEIGFPFPVQHSEWQIRNARPEELLTVARAHADVAILESGIDPLLTDMDGFLSRSLDRIKKGRTFVAVENGELIFKADILAETSDVAYLEGVYVAPELRGRGIGSKCLAKLNLMLLDRFHNICLLSNVDHRSAHICFEKAGFRRTGVCTALFA